MYDIIIIGGGPAGLTSAIYGRRANKKVLVLEANSCGGQILTTDKVDNYPGFSHITGFDFSNNLYNQVIELGADVNFEKAIDLVVDNPFVVVTEKNKYQAKSVILALGVRNKKLSIENEDKFLGKGISYCATCDGNFFKGKTVAVNGGGNTAVMDALYLSNICKKVYLIHRRDEFKCEDNSINLLKEKENVEFILNSTILIINGTDKLSSIDIKTKDDIKTIDVDGLFIAIGQIPENNNITNKIDLDEKGYITSNEECETNIKGVFVAGDIRTKSLRQLTTATADGSVAATKAIKYISSL